MAGTGDEGSSATSMVDLAKNNEPIAVLGKLLQQDPKDRTIWLSRQLKELSEGDSDVSNQPIFKLASEFKLAPMKKKQEVVNGFLIGIEDLELEQRTEVVKQFLQIAAPDEAGASDDLEGGADNDKKFLEKIMTISVEAGLPELQDSDMKSLYKKAEDPDIIQPILDVVPELGEGDRAKFKTVIVRAMPEEKAAMIEDGLKPGGLVYQVAMVLRWLKWAERHEWVAYVAPLAELIIAFVAPAYNGILNTWLFVDALLGVVGAICAHEAVWSLQPAYEQFKNDPDGMIREVSTARSESEDWMAKVPGLRRAALRACAFLILFAVSCVWAIIGITFCILAILELEAPVTLVLTLCFVVARISTVVSAVRFVIFVVEEYRHGQRLVSGTQDQPSYGATDDAGDNNELVEDGAPTFRGS